MAAVVTVNDVLDGHVVLDLECLDRIYVNGYVPNLQVGGQVASFLTQHLGNPIPSPAILEKIGTGFRRAVRSFAADNEIPVVQFGKDDRKIDVMRPYLAAQAATGRPGVAAIGVAQEFARVFLATKHTGQTTGVWFSFTKADRRVTCYYFYVWDDDFGPTFHYRAFEPEISARKVHRSSGSEAPADDLQRLVEPIHRIGIGQPRARNDSAPSSRRRKRSAHQR